MWWDRLSIEEKLEDVYEGLIELTEGETDQERIEYNEYLIDTVCESIKYIHILKKKLRDEYESKKI